ncbi:hypothetical protein F4V88_10740 [Neorhizobium galegae]|nr:hypothetical protein F4V88_10740 [Neorhizobium galegae]
MTEAKKASGSRIGEWFKNRRTAKAICPAERRTLPIGAIAGQNITEPKEKPPNGGVLPLEFFHWRPPWPAPFRSSPPATSARIPPEARRFPSQAAPSGRRSQRCPSPPRR